ncbi:conserved hypothetical protein (DUF1651) [Synechococcus sp. RS9907]|nr:conserved hypothetical protein (DUF1651) [Synechococcus sp. RS9907]
MIINHHNLEKAVDEGWLYSSQQFCHYKPHKAAVHPQWTSNRRSKEIGTLPQQTQSAIERQVSILRTPVFSANLKDQA